MEIPSLIISIYGNDFEGHAIKEILKKGILKSVGNEGTYVWIISDGTSSNLIQVIGEAIREFTDAYGENQIYGLALNIWSNINYADYLCSSNYQGIYPAEYQEVNDGNNQTKMLDQNHTHYLFVDIPQTENQFTSLINYRLEFENAVSSLRCHLETGIDSSTKVPICGILVSGSLNDLRLVHGSLVKQSKPFVIIKGSGGLANLICNILDEISEKNRKRKTVQETLEKENLLSMMSDLWEVENGFYDEIKMIKEIIDNRHLIEIFSLNEDVSSELDKKILSSLLSQNEKENKNYELLNVSQLRIAISINRYDVAKEKIFTEGKKWKNEDLIPLASKCLSDNKVEFVKLFVEKGFYLASIITVEYLEQLYTVDVFFGIKPVRQLKQALRAIKFKKINGKLTLYNIGEVLKYYLGDLFYPLYLNASFQKTINLKLPLNRPYLDLLIWCLLTQRMELAELLWTLESESVAAALFSANLLRCMADLTDIISDKHDLERWADIFEIKAEGVVEECFKENPEYTRENLIRELDYYGHLTYLELASDGNSIKFIAHRSVQELLDYVWRNTLDNTTRPFQFIFYLIYGITCPFIIPFAVQYKSKNYLPINQKEESKIKLNDNDSISDCEISDSRIFDKNTAVKSKTKYSCFYAKMYFKKLFDFYKTPIIKFSYTIISYVIFLIYFAYVNLTGYHVQNLYNSNVYVYLLLIIWTISLGFEEIRQAFDSGISFKAYLSDLWNIIDILAHSFFLMGTFAVSVTTADPFAKYLLFSLVDISPMAAISTTLIRLSKFLYGFSIFLFCVRILQYFSFNVNMGPIIVMIKNMLSNDLGPFMTILLTFLVSYGTLLWSINFEVKNNLNASEIPLLLYEMLRTAYFQLFGDIRMDILRNESQFSHCASSNLMCADAWGIWLGPVVTSIYLVLSSVLMLNLLIAIFSNTYEIIQSSATEYWTMERYNLMRQSSQKPSVVPPLIILWQIYFYFAKLFSIRIEGNNPFRTCYTNLPIKEKQLVQWEHLRAIDYMRGFDENSKKNRDKSTLVVNTRGPSIGSIGSVKKDLELIKTEIMENFKEKMAFIDNRMQRLDIIDNNVIDIIDLLRNIETTSIHTNSVIHHQTGSNQREIYGSKLENQLWKSSKKYFLLWGEKIQNHIILRIVPLINYNRILKIEFINESDEDSVEDEWRRNESVKNRRIPVNPHEVLNKVGTSLLPAWGINNCIHILISRWKRDKRGNIRKIFNKPVLQVLGINQNNASEIPFVIVQHQNSCLMDSCSMDLLMGILKNYINRVSTKNNERNKSFENNLSALNTATINEIHRGYISDLRNTDNSWMETVAFNVHQIYNLEFSSDFLKILEHDKLERVDWIDALETEWKNPSNKTLLRELTDLHSANF